MMIALQQNFAILSDVFDNTTYRYSGSWLPPASVWDQSGRFYCQNEELPLTFQIVEETTYRNKPVTVIE
jgi:hypothetical protein